MKCLVYRSDKKPETYLYLALTSRYENLPRELQQTFGEPVFVMRLELTSGKRLALADAEKVRARLKDQGYFLQLPPTVNIEEQISRRFS
jgi:uncharacterized protein YcgL (UPF0745 family)